MKILFIAPLDSVHTLKIVNSLSEMGYSICLAGLGNDFLKNLFHKNISLHYFGVSRITEGSSESSPKKFFYALILPKLKKIIKDFKPDIVHAHYASSNGLLAYLTNFHPLIISVWGGDIHDFPKVNFIYRKFLKLTLNSADLIFSTSKDLAAETSFYTNKEIVLSPFGIDLNKFKPSNNKDNSVITIGIVKSLERYYGIEYLIQAFALLKKRISHNIKLVIAGDGSLRQYFMNLVSELNITEYVKFLGRVEYDKVETVHNMLDIGCYVSVEESFGVSQLESLACGVPVVASNIGGIPEIIEDGVNGLLVPPRDVEKTADALEKLIVNPELRKQFALKGRAIVEEKFNWDNSIKIFVEYYDKLLKQREA